MRRSLQPIAAALKAARERKGLTQRALAQRVGLPQSHISKIENAAVDLQTTNLIQIARAVDLELTLVPRIALPAVQSLQDTGPTRVSLPAVQAMRKRVRQLSAAAETASAAYPGYSVLANIRRTANELERLPVRTLSSDSIREIDHIVAELLGELRNLHTAGQSQEMQPRSVEQAQSLARRLRHVRIALSMLAPAPEPVPAYRLDDEEEDDA